MIKKPYVPSYIPTEAEAEKALQSISNIIISRKTYSKKEIYESLSLQEELSRKHPTRALQLFIVSDNESLGRVFARVYGEDPKYSAIVDHIQKRFGVLRIRKQETGLKAQISEMEEDLYKQAIKRQEKSIRSKLSSRVSVA